MPIAPIPYENYNYDASLSLRDFTGRIFTLDDLNGKVIYGSCFSNTNLDAHIFSEGMLGVTFIKCNLDNVFIPEGNTVIDCSQRKIQVQNDGNDWEIDEDGNPIHPVDFNIYEKFGLEIPVPSEIPNKRVERSVNWFEVKNYEKIVAEEALSTKLEIK